MKTITIDVSKKVNGKFAKQGEVNIVVPTLEDAAAFVNGYEITGEEDGLPVYKSEEANWIQGAILAMVKAQARNKLVSGTATLKDGLSIATDWAGLIAEGVRGGGEALAIAREAKAAFAEWMGKQGKSEAATATVVTLFSNRQALALQSDANKAKIKVYVESFFESLDEAAGERFMKPVQAVLDTCEASTEVDF